MKAFLSITGMLTLAQWLFILLLHVFLTVQDKRSPETLNRLHEMPVIGGYFPAVEVPRPEDEERKKELAQLERIQMAKQYYELPDAFDPAELQTLIGEIRGQKAALAAQNLDIEEKRQELLQLVQDLERREKDLAMRTGKLEEHATSLRQLEREVTAKSQITDGAFDEIEMVNLKRIAGYLGGMEPQKAASLLVPEGLAKESEDKRKIRYQEAAKLLSLMDPEVAPQVVAALDPLDWLKVEAEQKKLPLKAKKK